MLAHLFASHDASGATFDWPVRLHSPQGAPGLVLRPIVADDEDEWFDARARNADWLRPWDSGDPMGGAAPSFAQWVKSMRADAKAGRGAQFVMEHNMAIVGYISLGAIDYGAMRDGVAGYWVDRRWAGHGFAPLALAMLCDWAMYDSLGPRLHRVEVSLLPQNARSRRVVEKVGFVCEGLRRSYMFVNGAWRDHECWALVADDHPAGVVAGLMARDAAVSAA